MVSKDASARIGMVRPSNLLQTRFQWSCLVLIQRRVVLIHSVAGELQKRNQEVKPMKGTIAAIGAGVAGAGLMYLFDPILGRRRRSLLVDKSNHVSRVVGRGVNSAARDFGHRVEGVFAKGVGAFKTQDVTDTILTEQIRSKLGRIVSNPGLIDVHVANGSVKLSGPVLQ